VPYAARWPGAGAPSPGCPMLLASASKTHALSNRDPDMMQLIASPLGRLRAIGMVEGASFLLLLFLAMPLKYLAGQPQYVSVVGAIHGALWIGYVASIIDVRLAIRWPWRRVGHALIASVLPFGPFVLEPGLRAEQRALAEGRAAGAGEQARPRAAATPGPREVGP
jgi:integral membrane protein